MVLGVEAFIQLSARAGGETEPIDLDGITLVFQLKHVGWNALLDLGATYSAQIPLLWDPTIEMDVTEVN